MCNSKVPRPPNRRSYDMPPQERGTEAQTWYARGRATAPPERAPARG